MIQDYHPPEDDDATPKEIAAEISANRHRIDSQLRQLARRVTPQALVQKATEKFTGHSFDASTDELSHYYEKARAFARRRPLGTALLALGLAVLLVESSKGKRNSSPRESEPRPNPNPRPDTVSRRFTPPRI